MALFSLMLISILLHRIRWTYEQNITLNDFTNEYEEIKNYIYSNYPNKTKSDAIFPPPKGSILERLPPGSEYYTKEFYAITTKVEILIRTKRIVKMDTEKQSLILAVQEMYYWNDESLKWNHAFANHSVQIRNMIFNKDKVWTPPVFPKNIFHQETIKDWLDVFSWDTGSAFTERTVQYTIPCSVNVREFPFDVHNCSLILTQPFGFHNRINLSQLSHRINNVSRDEIVYTIEGEHLEWELIHWSDEITYDPNYTHFAEFTFRLQLRRRATFYFIVLILPCTVLNLLSLAVFTLPVVDTERMDFCLALILTYFVLIMIVVDSSPPSGNQIPLLGLYIISSAGVVAVSFGMSMMLLGIYKHYQQKHRPMPKFLSSFLERFCCLSKRYKGCKDKMWRKSLRNNSRNEPNGGVKSFAISDEQGNEIMTTNQENDQLKEIFKWKLLGKVLNWFFSVTIILAHIFIPILIFLATKEHRHH